MTKLSRFTDRNSYDFSGLPMLRAYSSIHIDFMFRTREANGLILFNGGKKEDFVAVELVEGHINYIVNVGKYCKQLSSS